MVLSSGSSRTLGRSYVEDEDDDDDENEGLRFHGIQGIDRFMHREEA
jgi:hypothetical protein